MNKLTLTILFIGLFVNNLVAQQGPSPSNVLKDVKITGKIIDKETKEPLEYATVAFFSKQQNKIVTGGITDVKGNFNIPVPAGIYDVSIEYISFKKITLGDRRLLDDTNLGTFEMEIDAQSLGEVEVIAEKTTVEIRLDKKIYNVGKDLTVSGGTVSDVLDNVPSVSVDVEGNVALRGNDNVQILINGKPSGLVGLNSTDALRQLPAESIEKVEVITSPSARYESEGTAGILNIILRRSKLQGLNGAITLNGGHPDSYGINGNINYRTGNINIFNTSGYRYSNSPGNSLSLTEYYSTNSFVDEFRDTERIRKGINTNFGVEWYINDSASLTNSIVYRDSNNESTTLNEIFQYDSNRNLTGESSRLDPQFQDNKTVQFSSNFTKDFENDAKFTLEFQFEDTNEDQESNVIVDNLNSEIVTTLQEEERILLQSDYVLPIGENTQFELGYRGSFKDNITDYTVEILNDMTNNFEIDTNLSNVLNFKEDINALYTQYGTKFNKFSFLLGLRMENTRITIDQPTSGDYIKKNYTGLFPTVNLNYEISETENITLGYSRRLRRPRSRMINPFPSRSSVTSIFSGNPDLDPTYSGTYDLGYLNRFGKFVLSTSIYHTHSTNSWNFISFDSGETATVNGQEVPVIQRSPINLSTNDRYGYEFNLTYSPSRAWRINGDFNFFKSIDRGEFNGINFDNENVSYRARLSNKYTLPAKIDWQTTVSYRGPSEGAQSKSKGVISTNMAFSKDVFKGNGSISARVSDLFNTSMRQSETFTDTYESYGEFRWRQRSFNLSFTYRFNQKKQRQRQSREDMGGDEEMMF
ncbi:TonB-dependent receptor [Flavobacteriaceae bacterium S0825]|uniref:TonB-dependent receptor domain-containing protein n=1 Tax=Gaetbulibacter sp. S0825 TaxID=2720084 RepID=UPI0014319AD7|nr:TonB-dependent receptor [Gaetbulibacter sp. S0825]MCK0109622.1 TonB-dependent receptor [Flavobacteriaceae bacterium S0825]NIX65255.1 TonB-dependent receptor [Gaetbulibacter sp. S0825]